MPELKEIKIVSRWNSDKVILCGKYESVKDCLEKNKGADLFGAYLSGADLSGADLSGADLSGANLSGVDLSDANLSDANLSGANLSDANLSGADLYDADLSDTNLYDANLYGAKNYYNSHVFALEIIRRQSVKTFTDKEWAVIGQIAIHRFCWNTIKKEYGKIALSILKKLAKAGFDEFYKKIREKNE